MTNGANASYVNVGFVEDVLYIHGNSRVGCKIESEVFCISRELYDIASKMKEKCSLKFSLHLFGRIRRQRFFIDQL